MAKKELKTYSLDEMKNKFIGEVGTKSRDEYEYELRMDIIGRIIKQTRQERKLTQTQLGEIVGVKKSSNFQTGKQCEQRNDRYNHSCF